LIVVKIGGRTLQSNLEGIVDNISKLVEEKKEKFIIVHGGGQEIDEYTRKMNLEPKYVVSPSGIRSRLTDKEELKVVIMVLAGLINKNITHELLKRNMAAIGLTGLDAKLVEGKKRDKIIVVDDRGRKRLVDAGYTGRIDKINKDYLTKMLEIFNVIVLSPIIYSDDSPLNTDADYFASRIACELQADALIYLTDVDGVLINGVLQSKIALSITSDILNKIGPGMNRKVMHAIEAYKCGVKKVVISNGLISDPVEKALREQGSVITGD
jgi:acetylglutamate/LysW-gamma-L-alpha-aminoadipate kinase